MVSFIPNSVSNTIIITIYGLNGYDYRSSVYNDKEDRDPDLIRQPEDRALTSDPKATVSSEHRSSNHTSNYTKGSIIKVSYKYPPSTDAPIILVNNQTEACIMQVSYRYPPPSTVAFFIKGIDPKSTDKNVIPFYKVLALSHLVYIFVSNFTFLGRKQSWV